MHFQSKSYVKDALHNDREFQRQTNYQLWGLCTSACQQVRWADDILSPWNAEHKSWI